MEIPIVVIAYNRSNSLKRLLDSINSAYFDNDNVDLIISIDKSNNKRVYDIADEFIWKYGKKKIIKHQRNLGLREHVLSCGDIALNYDAIIMLEDDLIVSKSFYRYTKQSVDFYKKDKAIAGISLYMYRISEFANHRAFIPMQDDSDIFFMKVPSSWGQIWTNNQWSLFRKWYNNKEYENENLIDIIPEVAMNWGEASWKKYFYMYIALKNKYIVYPRIGLSTNMSDVGTHHKVASTDHQSVLMGDFNRSYIFKCLRDSYCIYDAFFENEKLQNILNLDQKVIVDYYGIKNLPDNAKYLLSTRNLDYKILREWRLALKPYELNLEYNIKGNDVFLYDLERPEINNKRKKYIKANIIKYELPGLTRDKALSVTVREFKEAIKRKFKKLL